MDARATNLVIVSNRLPVRIHKTADGWKVDPGDGGLVTAMAPVLRNRGGTWIGWAGTEWHEEIRTILRESTLQVGYQLRPVPLTAEEVQKYYLGFSNEAIWPLFHDLLDRCDFNPDNRRLYAQVNRKFAQEIAETCRAEDFLWVHDYHLMEVASELASLGAACRKGFFLHTPFPPLDLFIRLPWKFEFLQHLLQYDVLGFQTIRDKRNFLWCVRSLIREKKIQGKGNVSRIQAGSREVTVGSFPISIDFNEFSRMAGTSEVAEKAWFLHEDLPNRKIILGVDRLDYSKGIPHRLKAFRNALARHPDLRGNVTLVQVVVPSRAEIQEYKDLKEEIELLVSEVNGEFTQPGWVPVHYLYRSLPRTELLAWYRMAEIALVTPLKDGMNLVAKEYCASSIENDGVLILSEFAGAAAQLYRHALVVNPFDEEGVADAIWQAFTMAPEERSERMKKMRRSVRENDIFRWVDTFLKTAISKELQDFPAEDYRPQVKIE